MRIFTSTFLLSITAIPFKFFFIVWQHNNGLITLHSIKKLIQYPVQVPRVIIQCIARLMIMTFDRTLLFSRHIDRALIACCFEIKTSINCWFHVWHNVDCDYAQIFKACYYWQFATVSAFPSSFLCLIVRRPSVCVFVSTFNRRLNS